ncbi:MAG: YraN family protein [Planctomycetota bacterium]
MWPFSRRKPDDLGLRGEKLARRLVKRRGMKILAANYRCPVGEADLIALDPSGRYGRTLAFVEVKTRRSDRYTEPHSAVDADKQRRLRKIAEYYLNTHDTDGLAVRFDIVSVVMAEDEKPRAEYIPDAF